MIWDDLSKRAGKFVISRRFIEERHNDLFAVFGRMVIVRAEYLFMSDQIEYTAVSDLFEPIPEYAEAQNYIMRVTPDGIVFEKSLNARAGNASS